MNHINLVDLTAEIIVHCQNGELKNPPSDEWLRMHHLFYIELNKSSANEISNALDLDENLDLPFYMACDLHQKRVFLEESNPSYLLEFSRFLRINSNSWTYLADYFEKIALKIQKALEQI